MSRPYPRGGSHSSMHYNNSYGGYTFIRNVHPSLNVVYAPPKYPPGFLANPHTDLKSSYSYSVPRNFTHPNFISPELLRSAAAAHSTHSQPGPAISSSTVKPPSPSEPPKNDVMTLASSTGESSRPAISVNASLTNTASDTLSDYCSRYDSYMPFINSARNPDKSDQGKKTNSSSASEGNSTTATAIVSAKHPRAQRLSKASANPDIAEKNKLVDLREYFKRNYKTREYGGHDYKVHSVGWSCDGYRLASGSCDKTVCIFTLDAHKLKLDHVFRGHTDSVDQLRWHPLHPDLLGTASGDKSVKIWDARDQSIVGSFSTIGENINIAWCPNGNALAVGNKDDLITIIDVRAGKPLREEPYKFEVNEICWSPDCKYFLVTNGDGCIFVHDYPSFKVKNIIKAHPSNCICIEFRRDGEYFAVGAADAVVSLWNYKQLCCVRTFSHLDWPVRTLSFNYDGTLIASGSEDLTIDISQVSTGERVVELSVESPTFTVAMHPKRNILAYAGDDKNKYERDRDRGTIKVFGLPNDF